jgi:hypothetical protein
MSHRAKFRCNECKGYLIFHVLKSEPSETPSETYDPSILTYRVSDRFDSVCLV